MDYENKYNEALEKARIINSGKYVDIPTEETVLEYIFPELAESGDEKVRKTIIRFFKDNYPDETEMYDGTVTVGKAIAWLEKQQSVGEIVERCKDSWYNEGKIAGMAEGLIDDEKYQQGWHDALEKQGEKFINETDEKIVKAVKDTSVLDMVEQKPIEWSEEDKKMINILIKIFEIHHSDLVYPVNLEDITGRQIISSHDIIKWLKSLKERLTWQHYGNSSNDSYL